MGMRDRRRSAAEDELRAWRHELRRRRDPPWRVWLVAPLTALALLVLARLEGVW
jgi:hypothetical protein